MGSERYWARIQRKLDAMDAEAFATLGAVLGDHEPVVHRLAEIRVPTTVIVGAEDRPLLDPARVLAEEIDGAELVVVPDAAHSPQIENRDAWLAAVTGHLGRARR